MDAITVKDSEFKDLTILVAHCDDEFLFMFPALKNAKKIVCVTSDVDNPNRQWCRRRKEGFAEICKSLNIESVCMDFSSGFYKLPHKELFKCVETINQHIDSATALFTHNQWGEYGHIDHTLCNRIAQMTGKPVFTQDIVLQADWYPVRGFKQGAVVGYAENDMQFHKFCMETYQKYSAMGWTYPPVDHANIIRVIQ